MMPKSPSALLTRAGRLVILIITEFLAITELRLLHRIPRVYLMTNSKEHADKARKWSTQSWEDTPQY